MNADARADLTLRLADQNELIPKERLAQFGDAPVQRVEKTQWAAFTRGGQD